MDALNEARALSTGEAGERLAAAERLASLGPDAAQAAAPIVRACSDPSLAPWCVGALEELGAPPEEQLDELARLTADEHELVAYWAVTLLGRAGAAAGAHAPRLAILAEHGAPHAVRDRAVWALGKIGPPAAGSLRLLDRLAKAPDPRLASLAAHAAQSIRGGV